MITFAAATQPVLFGAQGKKSQYRAAHHASGNGNNGLSQLVHSFIDHIIKKVLKDKGLTAQNKLEVKLNGTQAFLTLQFASAAEVTKFVSALKNACPNNGKSITESTNKNGDSVLAIPMNGSGNLQVTLKAPKAFVFNKK